MHYFPEHINLVFRLTLNCLKKVCLIPNQLKIARVYVSCHVAAYFQRLMKPFLYIKYIILRSVLVAVNVSTIYH